MKRSIEKLKKKKMKISIVNSNINNDEKHLQVFFNFE